MSRPFLRRIAARAAPLSSTITGNRWLRRHLPSLADPDLWHLNRHSTARGVAIGLACGLIPGPVQAIAAALGCVMCRGNLPIAVATTFYTNPLTIVPLYAAAWHGARHGAAGAAGPDLRSRRRRFVHSLGIVDRHAARRRPADPRGAAGGRRLRRGPCRVALAHAARMATPRARARAPAVMRRRPARQPSP